MAKVAPSILSADFSNLALVLEQCEQGGADQVHVDVMDGHFVPNLTIGPQVVKDLRKQTSLPLDVHLMIEYPQEYISQFVDAGADFITIHAESSGDLQKTLKMIRNAGAKPGITLRPRSSLSLIKPYLSEVDLILAMSVEPGFGGQGFLPKSLERISSLRRLLQAEGSSDGQLSVDGGVKLDNAAEILAAGADILVAGSAIFKTVDPVKTIRQFKMIQ
ncbi:MAG: ribulose-phosphate 3-epimerase [Fidelibacterota bacterium]